MSSIRTLSAYSVKSFCRNMSVTKFWKRKRSLNDTVVCTAVDMQRDRLIKTAVSEQDLGKHVPGGSEIACNNRRTVFSMWSVPRSYNQDTWEFCEGGWEVTVLCFSWQFSREVLTSRQRRDHRSWRIPIVKIPYQETTSKSRLRTLSVCCSDL
jgi:hypothetical protein